jgi:hypothetical protein
MFIQLKVGNQADISDGRCGLAAISKPPKWVEQNSA